MSNTDGRRPDPKDISWDHDLTKMATLQDQPIQKPKKARINTAVYVTSLPSDSTLEEINSVFSKCGVIAEEIDRGQPRIKMYENDQGGFKGDALIVYFRPESVNLAIQMLDETSLRFGDAERMKVQAADFSYKNQQDAPVKSSKRDQKKVIRKTQKLNQYVHSYGLYEVR